MEETIEQNESVSIQTSNVNMSPDEKIRHLEELLEQKDKRISDKEAYVRKIQSGYDKKIAELSMQRNYVNSPKSEPPDSSKYTDTDAYLSDRLKWELKNNIRIEDLVREEVAKTRINGEIFERKKQFELSAAALKKEVPDFDEVAKSDIVMNIYGNSSNRLPDIIEGMDDGPKIAYYLGNNIDVAAKLAELPPEKLVPELIKLTGKINATTKKNNTSKIPINPVQGTSAVGLHKKTHEMTTDEWMSYRNKR